MLYWLFYKVRTHFFSPTRHFPHRTVNRLRFATESGELCGIAFGAPMSACTGFGPAGGYYRSGEYVTLFYHDLGLRMEFDARGVLSHRIDVAPDESGSPFIASRPSRIELQLSGERTMQIDATTTERDLLATLGPSDEPDYNEGSTLHEFVDGRTVITVFVDRETNLCTSVFLDELNTGES